MPDVYWHIEERAPVVGEYTYNLVNKMKKNKSVQKSRPVLKV